MKPSIALTLVVAFASLVYAVPDRAPLEKPSSQELPLVELDRLQKDSGAVFGDWCIWRHDEGGDAYFLINQKSGLGLYLWWGSNGWVNYRTREGVWYVLFPTGTPSLQDRKDLRIERFLGKQPAFRLATGKYAVKNWTITVSSDAIEMFTPNVMSRLNLRATSPEFTHNGRTIGGK
jgi:hypothetical protein